MKTEKATENNFKCLAKLDGEIKNNLKYNSLREN